MICGNNTRNCGFLQTCVNELCQCQSGFFTLTDFTTVSKTTNETLFCAGNHIALFILYSLVIIGLICSIVAYAIYIKRRSQLKRLITYFTGSFCASVMTIIRISAIESQSYGENVLVTILFSITIVMMFTMNYILQQKYLKVQRSVSMLMAEKYKKQLILRNRILFVGVVLSGMSMSILLLGLLLSTICLYRVSFLLLALSSTIYVLGPYLIAKGFLNDLEEIVQDRKSILKVFRNTKKIRKGITYLFMLYAIMFFSLTIELRLATYVVPLFLIFGSYISVYTISVNTQGFKDKLRRPSSIIQQIRRKSSKPSDLDSNKYYTPRYSLAKDDKKVVLPREPEDTKTKNMGFV